MKYGEQRREIVRACQDMNRRGINQGTSGNISVRVKEGFLLTPSGMTYDEMKPADIVLMKPDASHVGARKPATCRARQYCAASVSTSTASHIAFFKFGPTTIMP